MDTVQPSCLGLYLFVALPSCTQERKKHCVQMAKQDGRDKKPDKGKKNRTLDNSDMDQMDEINMHYLDQRVQELEFIMVSCQ